MTPVPWWHVLLAGFINAVMVVGIVQAVKVGLPIVNAAAPWLLPVLAAASGPLVAAAQSTLGRWLDVPIDLTPIVGAFSGGSAVMVHQVYRQLRPARRPMS